MNRQGWEAFCTSCGWVSPPLPNAFDAAQARLRHANENGCPTWNDSRSGYVRTAAEERVTS